MSNTAKTVAKIMASAIRTAAEPTKPVLIIGALYDFYDNIPRGGR